jgi:hypothetical protein
MRYSAFLLLFILSFSLRSQLLLNEISSSCNSAVLVDDNNNNSDWLEIYNPGASPVNASGFYITNLLSNPLKWQLPNVSIPASGFLKIYCSGENRINGSFYHSNFKLERVGETVFLFNAASVMIDNVTFGDLDQNHSYGRSPNGAATWSVYSTPTPNSSNNTTPYIGYCPTVTFSIDHGFYPAAQSLALACPGYTIRYTTDGTQPTIASNLYSSPISVPTTTLFKARTFSGAPNQLPGKIIVKSIFINETQLGYLPIVSISMDPTNFNNFYNSGNPNYAAQFAHLEYFRNKTKFLYETDMDLGPHGTTSFNLWPQKGMDVVCKGEYNTSKIKDTLFPWDDKKLLKKFDGFTLRHDYGGGGIWDGLPTQISRMNTTMDYLAYQPASVFVNGAYWGEYQVRERGDDDFVGSNFPPLNKDSLDMLHQTNASGNLLTVMKGSDTAFINAANYINANSPATQTFYNFFSARFDTKNFTDYYVAEIYTGNADWISPVNNYKVWRSQRPGGKWRYLFFDGDYAYGFQFVNHNLFPNLLSPPGGNLHAQIFSRVVQNPTYKNYFINRFADLLNTIYLPAQASVISTKYRDSLDPVIQRHIARWGNTTYPNWQSLFTNYFSSTWFTNRATNLRSHIQTAFTLTAQVTVTFQIIPPNAGNVLLNTIEPTVYPWSGIYYNGAPITVKSKAFAGYMFDHWESPDLGVPNNVDQNTVNIASSQLIKLFFVACPAAQTPTNVTTVSNQTICVSNSSTLSAIGSGTVTWYASPTSTTSIGTGTNFVTPAFGAVGTYTYYAENFDCIASASRLSVVVSVISCVGMTEQYFDPSQLKIYPNPTSKILNIDIGTTTAENLELIITNVMGETVFNEKIKEKISSFNIEHLANGIYFAAIKQNNSQVNKRMVIEKQ